MLSEIRRPAVDSARIRVVHGEDTARASSPLSTDSRVAEHGDRTCRRRTAGAPGGGGGRGDARGEPPPAGRGAGRAFTTPDRASPAAASHCLNVLSYRCAGSTENQ